MIVVRWAVTIFAAVCVAPLWASAQPAVTSGRIGSATIDVTKPNASPVLTLNITGMAGSVIVQYQSLSGLSSGSEMFYSQSFGQQAPGFTGKTVLQGYVSKFNGNGGVLSLYAEPGSWTLTNLSVCGFSGQCNAYDGATLGALFPRLTFEVANPGTPDTTLPAVASGHILTPKVSIAGGPAPAIDVQATDNLSGVNIVQVDASTPGFASTIILLNTLPTRPILNGSFRLSTSLQPDTTPGTYTIGSVTVVDNAGNAISVSDPSAIAKLFDNRTTITVSN